MERFAKWDDRTSGVNPFIPPAPQLPRSLPPRLLRYLVGACLVLIRLPILLLLLVLVLLSPMVSSPFSLTALASALTGLEYHTSGEVNLKGCALAAYGLLGLLIPRVGRLLHHFTARVIATMTLWWIRVSVTEVPGDLRRLGLSSSKDETRSPVCAGDIIVSNHCSFVEVLYLYAKHNPVFTRVGQLRNPKDSSISAVGLISALLGALNPPGPIVTDAPEGSTLLNVCTLAKKRGAPVVVFPEGCKGNGNGVLEFAPVFTSLATDGADQAPGVHLLGWSYKTGGFSPVQPAGSSLRQLWWLCFGIARCQATVARLYKNHVPPMPKEPAIRAWVDKLRWLMGTMIRKPTVALGMQDAVSFNAYRRLLLKGQKKEAASVASTREKVAGGGGGGGKELLQGRKQQ
ncbi:unnamed protein product [Chrysoparadoxa australica]